MCAVRERLDFLLETGQRISPGHPQSALFGEGLVVGESGFHQVRRGWTWGPKAESVEAALGTAMGIFEAAFKNAGKTQGSLEGWTCHSRQGL